MKRVTQAIMLMTVVSFMSLGGWDLALSDHDERKQGRGHKEAKRSDRDNDGHKRKHRSYSRAGDSLDAVNNPVYREECSVCHYAYPAGLLPSSSWKKLLSGLSDHFGEAIEMDAETLEVVSEYLDSHAAEHSSSRLSARVVRCLRGATPMRITEIPCIRHEHEEIRASVFRRESIGSRSNCLACHTTAEAGVFDEDTVTIPQ